MNDRARVNSRPVPPPPERGGGPKKISLTNTLTAAQNSLPRSSDDWAPLCYTSFWKQGRKKISRWWITGFRWSNLSSDFPPFALSFYPSIEFHRLSSLCCLRNLQISISLNARRFDRRTRKNRRFEASKLGETGRRAPESVPSCEMVRVSAFTGRPDDALGNEANGFASDHVTAEPEPVMSVPLPNLSFRIFFDRVGCSVLRESAEENSFRKVKVNFAEDPSLFSRQNWLRISFSRGAFLGDVNWVLGLPKVNAAAAGTGIVRASPIGIGRCWEVSLRIGPHLHNFWIHFLQRQITTDKHFPGLFVTGEK